MNSLRACILPAVLLSSVTGCQTANPRIAEHSAEYASLDPAVQKSVRNGIVQPGYSSAMVYVALGKPDTTEVDAAGNPVLVYRHHPATAYNETLRAGHRIRRVYDPVKQTEDVVVEPIDTKAFPNLIPFTLRITLDHDRVTGIERIDRV